MRACKYSHSGVCSGTLGSSSSRLRLTFAYRAIFDSSGRSPARNCLHEIKLQVVGLCCSRSTRYQHVAFEIADREEVGRFLTTANGMNGRYTARVARLTLGSNEPLTVTFSREHFVRMSRIPGE